jgi:RNA polymerase sigma-70 factor (ECF subfamily)
VVTEGSDAAQRLAETFRTEWPRLVAMAMRLVGDLQAAEDVVSDVLVTALDRWPLAEIPANPVAWLMTACRNRALNQIRDAGRARDRTLALAPLLVADVDPAAESIHAIGDDRLRLVFICCHPSLPDDGQVALTLRMLGGLSTADIARAWHLPEATIAQRIVRAKRMLADKKVPFEEPTGEELSVRLPAVLDVIYLIFNEGYLASAGERLTRPDLAAEAHRLARLLTELLPKQSEPWALVALIAFARSRELARVDASGNLLTMEYQDRRKWDPALIAEGSEDLARAEALAARDEASREARRSLGGDALSAQLLLQARLAGCHATAPSFADTDWATVIACYDELLARSPNAVVTLNRAVAVAMANGPHRALPLLDALVDEPALARSHRVWSIRADLLQRVGEHRRAIDDYDRALALVDNEVERRYLTEARHASGEKSRSAR